MMEKLYAESMQSPACYFLIVLQMGVCAAEQ